MATEDFFRSRLDQMIDLRHPLAVLAARMPWTQIGRFRTAIGEAGVEELLQATIDAAVGMKAIRRSEFERVIVDTTVQEKAIAHPLDSRLLDIARNKLVQAARAVGVKLKQTFAREGRTLRRRAGGYAHAKQWRRLRRVLKRRSAIEPVIGHLKADHRMDRCWLAGSQGDALHAVLCATGYNLRWLMRAVLRLGRKAFFALYTCSSRP